MRKDKLLWADDEIDLLKPHVLFLEEKGYDVSTVCSGQDAVEAVAAERFDLIFLDEHMPGLSGLETLARVKEVDPTVPVVMITKSEDEGIMNQAIGSKISDYLIKPVNPSQLLLSIKKNLHKSRIITETTASTYQQEFMKISSQISDSLTAEDWKEIYKKLVHWELELDESPTGMADLLRTQKQEANRRFGRFIKANYEHWITTPDAPDRPLLSTDIFKTQLFPRLDRGEKIFFILIDNFRLDQWRDIQDMVAEHFIIQEELYYSILPTATQYARNAIFSGLLPAQIEALFPELWVDEESEEGKNLNEAPLIRTQLDRFRKKYAFTYHKINESAYGDKLLQHFSQFDNQPLNVLVLNFVDMLSHARTESKMVRELASTEAAYRSLTRSWFKHSTALELFRRIADRGYKVVLTTDHGTVRVATPVKVIGDKNTNTNLRYKLGKNLNYNPKEVYEVPHPQRLGLPTPNVSTRYIFALDDSFFAYPNNYNHYVSYFTDTFQHGGISMEEMMIPLIHLEPK
jgi:DNA-binding response OmpR family regulator